jgi:hypothetical protein
VRASNFFQFCHVHVTGNFSPEIFAFAGNFSPEIFQKSHIEKTKHTDQRAHLPVRCKRRWRLRHFSGHRLTAAMRPMLQQES